MDGAIGQEIVVQFGQIRAARQAELQRRVDLGGDGAGPLDDAQDILLLLLDLAAQDAQMLDNIGSAVVRRGRGDVVQRRARGQRVGIGSSKELRIRSLQRHVGPLEYEREC